MPISFFLNLLTLKASRGHDKNSSDSAVSMKPPIFFAYSIISAKSNPYAKILKHINKGPRWVRNMEINGGKQSCDTVPLSTTSSINITPKIKASFAH